MNAPSSRRVFDDAIRFDDEPRTLVPDGEYLAAYTHHETSFIFKTPKVYIWFKIVDYGEHFEKTLYRAYRVKALSGRQRRNGGFQVRRGSDLYSDLVRLLEIRARPDRLSARALEGRIWRIKTRTVSTDYKQRPLPEWLRYSVVESIMGEASMSS